MKGHDARPTPRASGRLQEVGLCPFARLHLITDALANDALHTVLFEHRQRRRVLPVDRKHLQKIEPPLANRLPPSLPVLKGRDWAAVIVDQQRAELGPASRQPLGRPLDFGQPGHLSPGLAGPQQRGKRTARQQGRQGLAPGQACSSLFSGGHLLLPSLGHFGLHELRSPSVASCRSLSYIRRQILVAAMSFFSARPKASITSRLS